MSVGEAMGAGRRWNGALHFDGAHGGRRSVGAQPNIVQILLLIVVLAVSGCISRTPAPKPAPVLPPSAEQKVPFELQVLDDFYDGRTLRLRLQLTPQVAWKESDITLKLVGLRDGEEQGTYLFDARGAALQESNAVAGGVLAPEPYETVLEVEANDLSDYQIEVLWGAESSQWRSAAGAMARANVPTPSEVAIQALQVIAQPSQCGSPPCGFSYAIEGQLFNQSSGSVSTVVLGVGFVWVPSGAELDQLQSIPQNEEQLEVSDLNLAPGQSWPLRLVIDRQVPALPGGAYRPVVRVLSWR